MDDKEDVARYPALIIGLGGTGVRALRCMMLRGQPEVDGGLHRLLTDGEIQLLGIDTDQKANAPGTKIDKNVLDDSEIVSGFESDDGVILPTLDNFVWISPDRIENALPAIRTAVRQREEGRKHGLEAKDGELVHSAIARWFPASADSGETELTLGHSRTAGAGQYRPLGRVALFLEAGRIFTQLQRLYREVKGIAQRRNLPVRAYIISSLAGGTGAGMFWDIAFFLRLLDDSIITHGSFLMPEAFSGVDRAGRIRPNAYAALKELSIFKNLVQDEALTIEYPIGDGGMIYHGNPGGTAPFDKVFIYGDFKPRSRVRDLNVSVIDLSCLRIAQNVLNQLRCDIDYVIDVGANNESADTTAFPTDPEARYVFCSSGTAEFRLIETSAYRGALLASFGKALSARIEGRDAILVKQKLLESCQLARFALNGGSASLKECLKKCFEGEIKEIPKEINEQREGLEEQINVINDLINAHEKQAEREEAEAAAGGVPSTVQTQRLKENLTSSIENAIPEDAIKQWQAGMTDVGWLRTSPRKRDDILAKLKTRGEMFVNDASNRSFELATDLERVLLAMREDRTLLDSEVENFISDSFVERHKPSKRMREVFSLQAPRQFWMIQERGILSQDHERPGGKRGLEDSEYGLLLDATRIVLKDVLGQVEGDFVRGEESDRTEASDEAVAMFLKEKGGGFLALKDQSKTNKELRESREQDWLAFRRRRDWPEFASDEESSAFVRGFEHLRRALGRSLMRDEQVLAEAAKELHGFARRKLSGVVDQEKLSLFASENEREERFAAENKREERPPFPVLPTEKQWKAHLKAFFEAPDISRTALDDCVALLQKLVPWEPRYLTGKDQTEHYLELTLCCAETFVDYWLRRPVMLLQRAGGFEGLVERLRRSKSEVFRASRIQNTLKKENLVIVPPRREVLGVDNGSDLYKEIEKELKRAASYALGLDARMTNEDSAIPVIYYEDLFHSADEIDAIRLYFESYRKFKKAKRGYFHALPQGPDLDDVVMNADPPKTVRCGNDGCFENIASLPRTVLICPRCDNPIWNRCGNAVCGEDNLWARLKKLRADNGGGPPHECPECEQPLRTHWWECSEHPRRPVPMDKIRCPFCLEECRTGERPHDKIQRRPGEAKESCPGCISLGYSQREQEKIPGALVPMFKDGVNGHQTRDFAAAVREFRQDPNICRNRDHIHYLYPTCPEGEGDGTTRHHLYRNEAGNFVCQQHPRLRFQECYHCGYPIQADLLKQQDVETVSCPRCLRELRACDYCSETDGLLFAAAETPEPSEPRCPRCHNFLDRAADRLTEEVTAGLSGPSAFCRNLFQCRAGSMPWGTAVEEDRGHCQACRGDLAELLPFGDLHKYVESCPLCLMLIGTRRDSKLEKFSVQEVADHFRSQPQDSIDTHEHCPICAIQRASALSWILGSPEVGTPGQQADGDKEAKDDRHQSLAVENILDQIRAGSGQIVVPDSLKIDTTVEILRALVEHEDTREAFAAIRHFPEFGQNPDLVELTATNLPVVFQRDHASTKAMAERLDELQKLDRNLRRRQRGTRSQPRNKKPKSPPGRKK